MNKFYLLALALALTLPIQASAMNNESVYAWGEWAQNIQPAAGPAARVTPAPITQPSVNFRPNENQAFTRNAPRPAPPRPSDVIPPAPAVPTPAPPVVAEAPQLPNIAITASDTPTTSRDLF